MSVFSDLPASQPMLLFSALLVLKMGALSFATANTRRKSGVVVNPEDTKVNPGTRAAGEDAPETQRILRAHRNDLENIPAFLILALLFTLSGASATAGWAYFGVYFVARVLHSIFYLKAIQPGRTAAFFAGQLAMIGIIVQLFMKAL